MDAEPMIAYLEAEKGGDAVKDMLEEADALCYAHAVNMMEVHYHVQRRSDEATADLAIDTLIADGIILCEDIDMAFWKSISRLKARGSLSIADCFCIALAQRLGGEVVTTDHHEFDALVPLGLCSFRFIDDTRLLYSPTCALCKHLKSAMTPMCDAFPTENGIPDEIWTGKNDHPQAYPGDHGIQFGRRKQSTKTEPQETVPR